MAEKAVKATIRTSSASDTSAMSGIFRKSWPDSAVDLRSFSYENSTGGAP
jgi:hypothetical protein